MIWRAGPRFLALHAGTFALVDPAGNVVARYGTRQYSDEDDLWTWTHVVEGGRLLARTIVEHGADETRRDDTLVLDGLVAADDPEVHAFVATVLGDASVIAEDSRLRAECDAAAALARIPGATEDLDLGPELARAQRALGERVRRFGDPLAQQLLELAIRVGRARPPVAFVTAFARACLFAAFDRAPPELVPGEPVTLPDLARELAKSAHDLEELADGQENVDARNNAIAYRRAADAMREAARLAGG